MECCGRAYFMTYQNMLETLKNLFIKVCINTLNNHAPRKKKYTRGNHLPFMNKELSKIGLLPSKKFVFIYFNKSPLKMMKNAFYFMLNALLVK